MKILAKRQYDEEKLISLIEQNEVISFDVFDTLIKRDVSSPKRVFEIVERRALNEGITCEDFLLKRARAERDAVKNRTGEEATLELIYTNFQGIDDKHKQRLREIEIETEKDICCKNEIIIKVYNKCLELGKKIYVISDMYLPHSVIQEILHRAGITGYKRLFVSSDVGLRKATGHLFDYVAQEEAIDKKRWLHIGDALKGDYLMPIKSGLSACLIPRYIDNINSLTGLTFSQKHIENNLLYNFCGNRILKFKSSYEQLGYCIYGPFLYGMTKWLLDELKNDSINQVLFFSRDGYFFKKAIDYLQPDGIVARYCLLSRRSLTLPFMQDITNFEEFYHMVMESFPKTFSLNFFLQELFFSKEEIEKVAEKFKLDKEFDRFEIRTDKYFISFYKFVLPMLLDKGRREKEALTRYFASLGINLSKKVAVVDLGWRGSLQYRLEKLFDVKFYGYYAGIRPSDYHLSHAKGYLTSTDAGVNRLFGYSALLEVVFSAPHGSAIKYTDADGKYVIQYAEYEYKNSPTTKPISEIRKGLMEFVAEFSCYPLREVVNDRGVVFGTVMQVVGNYPTKQMLTFLKDFEFYDGEITYMVKTKPLHNYLLNPKQFIRDFFAARWKIGFLKKLFRYGNWYNSLYAVMKAVDMWRRK